MTVKYPDMRRELIRNMRKLTDPNYQERVWVRGIAAPNCVDCFGQVIHLFFDDSPLAEDPESCIGDILENASEAEAVRSVTQLLDALLSKYGTRLKDEEYMAKPEFAKIVEAARAACKIIRYDDEESDTDKESSTG